MMLEQQQKQTKAYTNFRLTSPHSHQPVTTRRNVFQTMTADVVDWDI